ncbi:MAG: PilZ domain-containing protein [Desulfuromonadaceae bacterium]|nr:PilZ domain-containing protein [Desulfuromonadaceae bacterium]
MKERRKHQRVETLNLVYYVVKKDGSELSQDMGRTLDASERGILIETRVPLAEGLELRMDIAMASSIIHLGGEVVHTHVSDLGMHLSGIEFAPMDAATRALFKEYLRKFEPTT